MDDAKAGQVRRKAMAEIEKEATEKNGLRNDVVTLYQGGQYHLYTYKKYTDVRLVFAPEFDIAFFGGDPDNFEYPRYDLDVCFFRAYENGKPAKIEHYLKWSPSGSKEGELVFVAGHPGRTDRLNTRGAASSTCATSSCPFRLDYLQDRGSVPAGIRPPRRRGVPAVQGGPLQRPEQPQGADRRPRGPARPGVHEAQGPGREAELRSRFSAAGQARDGLRRRLGQDRPGPEGRRRDRQALLLPRARLRL